jgi:hypothetical protein
VKDKNMFSWNETIQKLTEDNKDKIYKGKIDIQFDSGILFFYEPKYHSVKGNFDLTIGSGYIDGSDYFFSDIKIWLESCYQIHESF